MLKGTFDCLLFFLFSVIVSHLNCLVITCVSCYSQLLCVFVLFVFYSPVWPHLFVSTLNYTLQGLDCVV